MVMTPVTPPYSSTTRAKDFLRWRKVAKRSEADLDSGTKKGGRNRPSR